jgi:hypothetical protein
VLVNTLPACEPHRSRYSVGDGIRSTMRFAWLTDILRERGLLFTGRVV